MREIRTSGSEGGVAQTNAPFLPLSQRAGRPVVGAGFTPARMGWRKLQIAQSRVVVFRSTAERRYSIREGFPTARD